jgi:zona occludens toxin
MIHGISGKSGGGKSYEAVVSHIIPIVTRDKRKVVTNLPLNIERFCAVYGEECRDLIEVVDGEFHNYGGERPFSKVEHFTQYKDWQNEKGQRVYFFVDECHLSMPKIKCDQPLVEFISMARHSGFDIMLITQNFRKVNTDIKDNIVNHYRAIKKSMMGQDDKYILKVHDGSAASNASVVATHERTYEKKYFSFYTSHTDSDSAVDEATSNDIELWYKHWSIKASLGFFAFGLFIVFNQFLKSDEKKKVEPLVSDAQTINKTLKSGSVAPVLVPPVAAQREEPKTLRDLEYELMVKKSKTYHPFYKMQLTISGNSEYFENDRKVHQIYFSAIQNGQHIFTLKSSELMRAGYDVRILGECAVQIRYYDYQDFVTCNSPKQGVALPQDLASN